MPASDTTHINFAVNGLLRQIDTILGRDNEQIDKVLLREKIMVMRDAIMKQPDLDIPNDVFVGVSNDTRKLCLLSAGVMVLSDMILEEILKTIRDSDNN